MQHSVSGITKTQAAYSAIRASIESGFYPPGTRLRLKDLQEQLSFSITPIREALRMLQSDGVVTSSPHHGVTVTTHTSEEIDEVYRLRELIEPLAASYAAQRRTPAQLAEMQELYHELLVAAEAGQDAEAAALNARFHACIITASGSRLLEDLHERLRVVLPLNSLWIVSGHQQSNDDHLQVLQAIERCDAEAAHEAMRDHVHRGHQRSAERFGISRRPPEATE